MSEIDFNRRFGGVRRLYGDAGIAKLQAAHVVVIGIGGVGSWAAEALARNAVGTITLIDLDNIAESNFNRQIHALDGNIGKAKVTAMHERILSINPACKVHEIEDFITPENIENLLNFHIDESFGGILDCIDDAQAKVALAAFCKAKKIPLFMSGSAGGRLDATCIKTADLSLVTDDKLLAKVRNQLRRQHQFPKATNTKKSAKFGITCVYSNEPVLAPSTLCDVEKNHNHMPDIKGNALEANIYGASDDAKNARENSIDRVSVRKDSSAITGLNCAGYGSSVSVTAAFGLVAASLVLKSLLR